MSLNGNNKDDLGHTRYPRLCKLEELILWLHMFSFIMLIYQACNGGSMISVFARVFLS